MPAQSAGKASCEGLKISNIEINPERPSFAGSAAKWRSIAHAIGLHHTTTRAGVINAYLLFKIGDVCTPEQLSESRRVLRSLPFLADAEVTALPDSSGGVVVQVRTVDEGPVLATGRLRGGVPDALSLGNENVGGLGARMLVGGERDQVYRGSRRLDLAKYGLFKTDIYGHTELAREHLGGHVTLELAHPFLSSLQHATWQASYRDGRDYPYIFGPSPDNETVGLGGLQWSLSGALRRDFGPMVTLLGAVALGTRLDRQSPALLVTDSGAVAIQDTIVTGGVIPYTATRIGALLGARRVRFEARQGLDALFATQDMMLGWQIGGVVGPSLASRNYHDLLVVPGAYFAGASTHLFAFLHAEAEVMSAMGNAAGNSVILNARSVAYATPTSRFSMQIEDNFSVLDHARVPTQLTMSDPVGGPRGYLGSRLAGGQRNLTRFELRLATPNAIRGADLGVGLFADAATLWAGNVPYGTSAGRQSVGISLLGAYPTKSKRLYRLDFAFPLERDNGRSVELRFTAGNPAVRSTAEPYDVTQARQAPISSALVAWPQR